MLCPHCKDNKQGVAKKLPMRDMPKWLCNIKNIDDMKGVSIKDVLKSSLYYPCSGRDGDPVKFLSGFCHSFVYVDNGITLKQVENSIHNLNDQIRNFKGYDAVLEIRDHFIIKNKFKMNGRSINYDLRNSWYILEKQKEYCFEYGPDRISMLFIHGDAVETFSALYIYNKSYPELVALIKAGWMGSDFYEKDSELAKAILGNLFGCPKFMLECGKGKTSCWGSHIKLINRWHVNSDGIDLGLWALK